MTLTQLKPQAGFFGQAEDGGADILLLESQSIAQVPGTVKQVSSTNSCWYALTTDGKVWAQGLGLNGQLGNGQHAASSPAFPVQVGPFGAFPISFLSDTSPADTMMCVDTNGVPWGWGSNGHSQLGNNSTVEVDSPISISLPGACTALAGAGDHAMFVVGGNVYSTGAVSSVPYYGQLGLGAGTTSCPTPTIIPSFSNIVKVYASWRTSAALDSSGNFYCWGYNGNGNCGNGDNTFANVVTPFQVSLRARVTLACLGGSVASDGTCFVILSDGSMWAWGNDTDGQLGDGGSATAVVTPINPTPAATFVKIACTGATSFGLDAAGNLWGWGNNANYQFGLGNTTSPQLVPKKINRATSIFSSISGCGNGAVAGLMTSPVPTADLSTQQV